MKKLNKPANKKNTAKPSGRKKLAVKALKNENEVLRNSQVNYSEFNKLKAEIQY